MEVQVLRRSRDGATSETVVIETKAERKLRREESDARRVVLARRPHRRNPNRCYRKD